MVSLRRASRQFVSDGTVPILSIRDLERRTQCIDSLRTFVDKHTYTASAHRQMSTFLSLVKKQWSLTSLSALTRCVTIATFICEEVISGCVLLRFVYNSFVMSARSRDLTESVICLAKFIIRRRKVLVNISEKREFALFEE